MLWPISNLVAFPYPMTSSLEYPNFMGARYEASRRMEKFDVKASCAKARLWDGENPRGIGVENQQGGREV